MPFAHLLYEVRDNIAVLTLNRPKVLNALNRATLDELDAAVQQLREDAAVRSAIITGAGDKAFAAGADIAELAALSGVEGRQLALRGQAVFAAIENCGKPILAAINGFALGGGCELAMSCTLRIASDTARLGQPEVKLGLIPGYGGTQRLPRLIGRGAALKLLLTGEMIGAAEALRIGLVDEVVPAGELLPRAESLARAIGANAPLAISGCLAAVNEGADLPLDRALATEAALFGIACSSEDKGEGTRAFLEKRAAAWKGR